MVSISLAMTQSVMNVSCLVTVDVKARIVTVKGPRGEVKKNFSHLATELQKMNLKEKKRTGQDHPRESSFSKETAIEIGYIQC